MNCAIHYVDTVKFEEKYLGNWRFSTSKTQISYNYTV